MELFLIYLWLKLDGLSIFLGISSSLLVILTLLLFIPRAIENWEDNSTEEEKRWIKRHNHMMWASVLGIVLALFTPTSKEVAILVGSNIALDAAKSPEGIKVASLLRHKANELLDAELQKLTPKKGN